MPPKKIFKTDDQKQKTLVQFFTSESTGNRESEDLTKVSEISSATHSRESDVLTSSSSEIVERTEEKNVPSSSEMCDTQQTANGHLVSRTRLSLSLGPD